MLANQKPELKQTDVYLDTCKSFKLELLVLSGIDLLLLQEIKLHKQTKDDVKQTAQAPVSCLHANCKVEFPEKLHPGRSFPKAPVLPI